MSLRAFRSTAPLRSLWGRLCSLSQRSSAAGNLAAAVEATDAETTAADESRAIHVVARRPLFQRIVLPHAGLAAILLFAACFLSPLLGSGFIQDDIKNACVDGWARQLNCSVWDLIGLQSINSMCNGRCFPGALALTFTVHQVFSSELPYKCFILALALSNLVAFYYLLRCWHASRAVAQLGTLGLVLLMQMRVFYDPLLAYAGLLPVVAGQLLLSLIFLQKHLESRRTGWLVGSLVMYTLSLLTYEISFLFLPVHLMTAYAHSRHWRSTLDAVRPFLLVLGTLLAFTFGLRSCVTMDKDNPYRFNLVPSIFAETALCQASAALPLSYPLLSDYRKTETDLRRLFGRWDNWSMALAAAMLTLVLLRKMPAPAASDKEPSSGLLIAVGFALWLLPGVAIAPSVKYQSCVRAGLGYLPVYIQYCGVALLSVAGLLWLARRSSAYRVRLACGLVVANACIAMLTFDTNRHVVELLTARPDAQSHRLLERALDAGLGAEVPQGATVMTTDSHPVVSLGPPLSSRFVIQHLKRNVNAVSRVVAKWTPPFSTQLGTLPAPTFVLHDKCWDAHSGYALMSAVESEESGPGDDRFATRRFRVFVRGAVRSLVCETGRGAVVGEILQGDSGRDDDPRQKLPCSQLKLVESESDWAIFEGRFAVAVNAATIVVCKAPVTEAIGQRQVSMMIPANETE